ncbi:DHA2 family efflux MFS transporter permease subunit [Paenibacillus sp. F411]|uniref:Drug/metabolite transporter, DMT super n=1 Tax=Paenibacillus algicola TaxID=2565926 RepID=A0A4P8XN81_9BACL|nr:MULTISPECIES: DHA2 family efflux MFS transporter permease subunit [Paenibacillus]MBO2945591.1 DHA2 family efflux MFS transporter permease subunit [Paenibacillus sp. F411]QCT04316.1 Drug/metabolite transporter, DMT super [Paenibacillus algicola]
MEDTHKQTPAIPRSVYLIIGILLAGAFVSLLSNTLLNIALPSIMNYFELSSPSTVQWLTTGYMLVNGIMIPTTAFLIQRFSVRGLFLTAMTLFTLGTMLGGFAPSFGILLTGRMIQASGSAIMMPLLMNVMLTSFPVEKRGGAMGMFGLVMIFAPAIGPTLSGFIIERYDRWDMLFHLIWPIALLVLLFGFIKLRDHKESVAIHLDSLSIALSSIGFGGILYGFSTAGNTDLGGWDNIIVYYTLAAGFIGLLLFIVRQFKLEKPMLDFRVYRYPMFALSSVISIMMNMAMFSAMLLMPIYLQTIRGISPLDSGLLLLPGAIVMGIMSPITGKLFDKFGAKLLVFTGLAISVVTSYMFSQLTLSTAYSTLIVIYTLRMFGMSMVMMPIMTNGLNQLPMRYTPHGTAMNSTLSQVSGAIGTSLLVTIMTTRTKSYVESMVSEAAAGLPAQPTGEQLQQLAAEVTPQATVHGINDSFMVSVVLLLAALLLSLFIKRTSPSKDKNPETAPAARTPQVKRA